MEKSPLNIDQQLKGMFETFEPAVPFQFEKVAAGLDAKKRGRRSIMLWSSVAAVVFTAVSGIIFLTPDTARVNEISKNQPNIEQTEISSSIKPNDNLASDDSRPVQRNQVNELKVTEETNIISEEVNKPQIGAVYFLGGNNNSISTSSRLYNLSNDIDAENTPLEVVENLNEWVYSDFSGKSIETIPTSFGYFLQLPVRIHSPQKPNQPLSSWAFEVGYDQNQTAMAYQISSGREKYVHKNYINRMKEGEFALNAPQIQAALKRYINKNWFVSLGLGFAQTRTMQRFNFRDSIPVSVSQGFEADALGNFPIFGYLGLGQQIAYEGIQTVQMLSVPISVGYQYPINRFWSFSSEISTRYNRLFASQGKTLNYHDLSLLETGNEIYRAGIWSGRLSAGAEYRLSRNQYLGLRLNTQGAFTPFYKKDASIVNRGWSVGMSVFYTMKLF